MSASSVQGADSNVPAAQDEHAAQILSLVAVARTSVYWPSLAKHDVSGSHLKRQNGTAAAQLLVLSNLVHGV